MFQPNLSIRDDRRRNVEEGHVGACAHAGGAVVVLSRQFEGELRRLVVGTNVPRHLDVHLVMDNYGTHKTALVRRWLLKRPRFHVHFTPTSASWINLVERWFVRLSQKQIKRGSHRSSRELVTAIQRFMTIHNERPKPFVWTKTADEILQSVARVFIRTSGTGH